MCSCERLQSPKQSIACSDEVAGLGRHTWSTCNYESAFRAQRSFNSTHAGTFVNTLDSKHLLFSFFRSALCFLTSGGWIVWCKMLTSLLSWHYGGSTEQDSNKPCQSTEQHLRCETCHALVEANWSQTRPSGEREQLLHWDEQSHRQRE